MPHTSGKRDTPFSFYLPHPQTFSNNSLLLSEEKRIFAKEKLHWAICKQAFIALAGIIFTEEAILFNDEDMTFLDMALPIHNFTYIQVYRAKSVKLRQPNWYLLIHPSHNIHHFIVYHLNFIEIPTNCFIMIYPIAQATEFV